MLRYSLPCDPPTTAVWPAIIHITAIDIPRAVSCLRAPVCRAQSTGWPAHPQLRSCRPRGPAGLIIHLAVYFRQPTRGGRAVIWRQREDRRLTRPRALAERLESGGERAWPQLLVREVTHSPDQFSNNPVNHLLHPLQNSTPASRAPRPSHSPDPPIQHHPSTPNEPFAPCPRAA